MLDCNEVMIERENTLVMWDCIVVMWAREMMMNSPIDCLMVCRVATSASIAAKLENKWVMHCFRHDHSVSRSAMSDCMSVMLDCRKVSMVPMEIEGNMLARLGCKSAMLDCMMDSSVCKKDSMVSRMDFVANTSTKENTLVMAHLLNIRVRKENSVDSKASNRVMMANNQDSLVNTKVMMVNNSDLSDCISVTCDN
jgi:hypothetical protein